MLERLRFALLNLDQLVIRFLNFLHALLVNLTRMAVAIGLIGSLLLVLFPTMDDAILRETTQTLISKYNNLSPEQKFQIKEIFRDIFLTEQAD